MKFQASPGRRVLTAAAVLCASISWSASAESQVTLADYERAAIFQNARTLVARTGIEPNWIEGGDRFWFVDEQEQLKTFVLVDPARNRQGPAFDHARLAAVLSAASGNPYQGHALPFSRFEYQDAGVAIAFDLDGSRWRCNLRRPVCSASTLTFQSRAGEVLSPDGRWAVFGKDHNLWIRDQHNGQETALTRDGEDCHAYGRALCDLPSERLLQKPPALQAYFSPDSRRILTFRTDLRQLRELALIQTVPAARPRTHVYRYPIAGDEAIPQVEAFIVDVQDKTLRSVAYPAFGRLAHYDTSVCWSEDSREACFTEDDRGYKTRQLHIVKLDSGQVRTASLESSETYLPRPSQVRLLGPNLIWSSERDGWNHLYRLDARDGTVKQQLTRGSWAVREIVHLDAKRGFIYFLAGGREPGQDPYYRHLYRVRLDGTGLTHLSPEPADHDIRFSPAGNYFVDTYSRIDLPPVSLLRRADGRLVRVLARADITRLQAAGWRAPQPFSVKASDGQTDLYGAIFLPSHFQPGRTYPVLDSIYPGPQVIKTPKAFDVRLSENELALAELGFVVVTLDAPGTPLRSKAFRDRSYRNMGGGGGLDQHIAALRQLAARHPYLDLDRVGIFGHSGGGYASARALLKFPDFFKVAVASSGNHEQRSYWAEWGERYHDWPVNDANYSAQANAPLAAGLRGRLLLAYGDMDENVHPANTLQLIDALVAANKDFDLLVLPNRDHGLVDLARGKDAVLRMDPYFLRRRWDYFVEHLLNVTPPREFHLELK